jgi:glyceraldehyde-3-phosphate dehydrogenase/erythrose-4-phosphate dehydrogenase
MQAGQTPEEIWRCNLQVNGEILVKIYAWYDNEQGFACRYIDELQLAASEL